MPNFDIKKVPLPPASPKHTQHARYLQLVKKQGLRRHWSRVAWSGALVAIAGLFSAGALLVADSDYLSWSYVERSQIEQISIRFLSRYNTLPVEAENPKGGALAAYLAEKKSPLADYAGLISRLPNWKMLVGIAHAESNLCKKTDRNNCWGIGPGGPWTFGEISESLYYANYLLSKFDQMGMDKPESLVRTYVGYHNPNWVEAINDVFYELRQRGLQ